MESTREMFREMRAQYNIFHEGSEVLTEKSNVAGSTGRTDCAESIGPYSGGNTV